MKKTPHILFLLVYAISLFTSVNTYATLKSNTLFTDYTECKKSDTGLVVQIESMQQGDSIRGDQFYFSDITLVKALANALNKGVKVSLNLDAKIPSNKKTGELLVAAIIEKKLKKNLTIRYLKKAHAKAWSFEFKDKKAPSTPRKKTPSSKENAFRNTSHIGSANASQRAHQNFETIISTNNPNVWAQLNEFHDNPPATPKKRTKRDTIERTPLKAGVLHSYETKLNASRIKRIQTAIRKKSKNPKQKIAIEMCTMNINDSNTFKALSDAAQAKIKINLYLDKDAISAGHKIEQLKQLSNDGVTIFIFDPENLQSAIMHSKGFLRTIEDKNFLEILTANATHTGDDERNLSLYEPNPNDEQVVAFQAHLETIKKASTNFKEINLAATLRARKKRKTPGSKKEEAPAAGKKRKLSSSKDKETSAPKKAKPDSDSLKKKLTFKSFD